jgi:hypothetical protein
LRASAAPCFLPREEREKQHHAALPRKRRQNYRPPVMIGDLIKIQPEQLSTKKVRPRKKALYKRRWVHVTLILLVLVGVGGWLGQWPI